MTNSRSVGAFVLALSMPSSLFMVNSFILRPRPLPAPCNYSTSTLSRMLYPRRGRPTRRFSEERADGDSPDYAREETLLCMDLIVQPGVAPDQAMAKVSQFCQSFPFAAVLPVQPLQYLPVYEDGGVEVKFLRKKTDIKSGIDGGVRFFIETTPENDDDDNDDDDVDEGDDNENAATTSSSLSSTLIEVTAKRNSKGQTIAKLMAEKLIVTNFVAAITGEPEARQRLGSSSIAIEDFVQVRSIYHKWM